jgi:hypothetical protein
MFVNGNPLCLSRRDLRWSGVFAHRASRVRACHKAVNGELAGHANRGANMSSNDATVITKVRRTKIAMIGIGKLLTLASCMRMAKIGDAALEPFAGMYSVDRSQYGFTPLPKTGTVFIEGKSSSGNYDAMLHFGGNPSRTIAFRWDGKIYQWLGEQETFEGPTTFETPDGRFHESVTITFYREAVPGEPQGLTIGYSGPDARLTAPRPERKNWSLTLAEVNPLIERWGFRK